jgi:LPS-assembly lipoprotein
MDRNILDCGALVVAAISLGACGFQPLYARYDLDPSVGPALSAVHVEPIPDRVGYELRNHLLDLFHGTGTAEGARYRLRLSLVEMQDAVILQANTAITRFNYTLTARYDLIASGATVPVKSGNITALSAYNVAAAPFLFATVAAERDAKNRAANDVAERIRTEIAIYLRSTAQAQR